MRKAGVGDPPRPIIASGSSRAAAQGPEASASPPEPPGDEEATTRRSFFRLDVFDVSVWFQAERIGQRDVVHEQVTGRLVDVSGGGLRMAGDAAAVVPAWRVREGVTGRVHFTLLAKEAAFELPARLVRLTETPGGFQLALQWDRPPQAEVDRLAHALYRLEVRHRARAPDARRPGRRRRPTPRLAPAAPRSRRPALLGAALGLAAAGALQQTAGGPALAITAALAVLLALVYVLTGA